VGGERATAAMGGTREAPSKKKKKKKTGIGDVKRGEGRGSWGRISLKLNLGRQGERNCRGSANAPSPGRLLRKKEKEPWSSPGCVGRSSAVQFWGIRGQSGQLSV